MRISIIMSTISMLGCSVTLPTDQCIWSGTKCSRAAPNEDSPPPEEAPPEGCSVSDSGLVTCDRGSFQIPTPEPGEDGEDGTDGADGRNGTDGLAGPPGRDGANGVNGSNGRDGTNGLDGVDGVNGADGQDGLPAPPSDYTITELIDPCGDGPGFDEVLLRTANGALLAHYADGVKQFLTTVPPGTYISTDGQACVFTVSPSGSVTW